MYMTERKLIFPTVDIEFDIPRVEALVFQTTSNFGQIANLMIKNANLPIKNVCSSIRVLVNMWLRFWISRI